MKETIRRPYTLPGPRSEAVLEELRRYVSAAVPVYLPAVIERASGALLTDVDGHTFIDLVGGVGCLNVGHAHPRVVGAITEQAARFTHTDFAVAPYGGYVSLAQRLCALAPGRGLKKAIFLNSGSEAVESAVKIARAVTGRPAIIAFEGAFHGRTYMSMTLTSKIDPYKRNFGPFVPEVYRAPYADPYRSPEPDATRWALRGLENLLVTHVQPDKVAAVIVEPILGEGGFIVPPPDFLDTLRAFTRRHGMLLIVDEVQTGIGRTGRMFATEYTGVEPDLLVAAKSLAAGLPLSAVIGTAALMDAMPESSLGGTYVGNPIACAAALAVLDVIEDEGLLARAEALGRQMITRFRRLADRAPLVGDVRGLGAMVAIELVRDRRTKAPAPEAAAEVIRRAMARGVLLLKAGVHNNVIRILAPLVITEEQLGEALDVLEDAVLEVSSGAEGTTGQGVKATGQ